MRVLRTFAVVSMLISHVPVLAQSKGMDVPTIVATVKQICQRPDTVGVSRTHGGGVSGHVDLKSLFKKFSDAGVNVNAVARENDWSGLRQQDLASAMSNYNSCSQNMFSLMFKHFFASTGRQPIVDYPSHNTKPNGPKKERFFILEVSPGSIRIHFTNPLAVPIVLAQGILTCGTDAADLKTNSAFAHIDGNSVLRFFSMMPKGGDEAVIPASTSLDPVYEPVTDEKHVLNIDDLAAFLKFPNMVCTLQINYLKNDHRLHLITPFSKDDLALVVNESGFG